jgi:hypothetical protein
MNWADQVKATALTVAAERTAAVGRIAVDAPWSWNPHDVWLSRVKQPREIAIPSARSVATAQPRQGIALRD